MGKTPFSDKCNILGNLWLFYSEQGKESEGWSEFFEWANVGLPLAYASWQGLATIKGEGKDIINDTWEVFCKVIAIDPMEKYADLNAAFDASPNPVLA